jgi:hypothetical protein
MLCFKIIYHSDWITKFVKTIKLKHAHGGLKDGTKLLLVLAHPSPIPSPHVQLLQAPINHNIVMFHNLPITRQIIPSYLG